MKLLALDTSTEACSAALSIQGEVRQRFELTPGGHGQRILVLINSLLDEAGIDLSALDALAFGRGPGGFTGVRMATGVIQGLSLGLDLPVVAVSSLAALAQGAADELGFRDVLAAIDARMNEVYWGVYRVADNGLVKAVGEERVAPPGALEAPPAGRWWGVGSGWVSHADALGARLGGRLAGVSADRFPRAREVAMLAAQAYRQGHTLRTDEVAPVYLRERVARKPGE